MITTRQVEAIVVWTITIILAAVFLLAGVPKVLGIETVGLQAAAMQGFPPFVRVIAGLVEVAGAVCLLIPRTSTLASLLLAFVMIPATLTQYVSGEPGVWVPIVLLVALLFVAWRHSAKVVTDSYHQFVDTPHPLLYDGVIAGLIGATLIAAWFLLIDSINGRPLFTPATLGQAMVGVLGPIPPGEGTVTFVLAYTVFHFAAFMVVGLISSLIVNIARREPSILFFFIILFVMTEVGVYAIVGLLDVASVFGRGAWLQIMAGNLFAAIAMGYYFLRTHRELREEFRHSLDWEAKPEEWGMTPPAEATKPTAGVNGPGAPRM